MNKKDALIQLRITEQDKIKLQEKAKEAGLSLTELVRDYILNDKTEIVPKQDIIAILYQINKIGNNINQLAKRVNQDFLLGSISDNTYAKVIANLKIYSSEVNVLTKLIKMKE